MLSFPLFLVRGPLLTLGHPLSLQRVSSPCLCTRPSIFFSFHLARRICFWFSVFLRDRQVILLFFCQCGRTRPCGLPPFLLSFGDSAACKTLVPPGAFLPNWEGLPGLFVLCFSVQHGFCLNPFISRQFPPPQAGFFSFPRVRHPFSLLWVQTYHHTEMAGLSFF